MNLNRIVRFKSSKRIFIDSIFLAPVTAETVNKSVDLPSARRLAKRLYALDGFKSIDVVRHLCKRYIEKKNNKTSHSTNLRRLREIHYSPISLTLHYLCDLCEQNMRCSMLDEFFFLMFFSFIPQFLI
jgi:hypothetical protein